MAHTLSPFGDPYRLLQGFPLGPAPTIPRLFPTPFPMAKTTKASAAPTYEEALAELEQLVAVMEAGTVPLDQLLAGYKRGTALLTLCRDQLQAVEQQVKVLEDGTLKAWEG